MDARYQDPAYGRFTQADYWELGFETPGTFCGTSYEHVVNNPIGFTDPTGHWPNILPPGLYDENIPSRVPLDPSPTQGPVPPRIWCTGGVSCTSAIIDGTAFVETGLGVFGAFGTGGILAASTIGGTRIDCRG